MTTAAFCCPKCGSENTQRLSLVTLSGTQTGSSGGRMIGYSKGTGLIIGGGASRGRSSSDLAMICAPPNKPRLPISPFVIAVIGLIAISSSKPMGIVLLITAAIFGVFFGIIYLKLVERYEHRFGIWSQSFLCQRCSTVSILDSETSYLHFRGHQEPDERQVGPVMAAAGGVAISAIVIICAGGVLSATQPDATVSSNVVNSSTDGANISAIPSDLNDMLDKPSTQEGSAIDNASLALDQAGDALSRSDQVSPATDSRQAQSFTPSAASADQQPVSADPSPDDQSNPDNPPQEDLIHQRARAQGWCDGGTYSGNGEIKWVRCP